MAWGYLWDSDGVCRREGYLSCFVVLVTGHKKGCSKTKHFNYKEFAMKDKRKTCEEKFGTQLQSLGRPEGRRRKDLDKVRTAYPPRGLKIQMNPAAGPLADRHARILAEAIILQSIEDLWHPVGKKGSLMFFKGDGFELCSEIAGIGYIKQLAMLRMLAYAGPIINLRAMRTTL